MTTLNAQGIISVVTIIIYIPIFFFALRICIKYGIKRGWSWLLLVLVSLMQMIGGALIVAAELIVPVVTGLYSGGYGLESSALSPLLFATLGLLEIITEGPNGERPRYFMFVFISLQIAGLVALPLMIFGTNSTSGSATTERRVAVLLFASMYIVLVVTTILQWAGRQRLMKNRKQLLTAVLASLPFLGIRMLYSVLSIFSSNTLATDDSTGSDTNSLAKFNMFTGEWQIYLIMGVLMEYVVVVIYLLAGAALRLDKDYSLQEDEYPLNNPYTNSSAQ